MMRRAFRKISSTPGPFRNPSNVFCVHSESDPGLSGSYVPLLEMSLTTRLILNQPTAT
jgi:hypothetical protein